VRIGGKRGVWAQQGIKGWSKRATHVLDAYQGRLTGLHPSIGVRRRPDYMTIADGKREGQRGQWIGIMRGMNE